MSVQSLQMIIAFNSPRCQSLKLSVTIPLSIFLKGYKSQILSLCALNIGLGATGHCFVCCALLAAELSVQFIISENCMQNYVASVHRAADSVVQ